MLFKEEPESAEQSAEATPEPESQEQSAETTPEPQGLIHAFFPMVPLFFSPFFYGPPIVSSPFLAHRRELDPKH